MAFDPTKPVEHTELDAAEMRRQFNGLKEIIDTPNPDVAALTARVAALEAQLAALQNGLDYCTRNLPNYRAQQVGPLALTVSDPPTQADGQAAVDKLNQFITALGTEA